MEFLSPPSMEGLDALLSVSASTISSYFLTGNYKPLVMNGFFFASQKTNGKLMKNMIETNGQYKVSFHINDAFTQLKKIISCLG